MEYLKDMIFESNLDKQTVEKDLKKIQKQAKRFAELIKDNYVIPTWQRHLIVWKDRFSRDKEIIFRSGNEVLWCAIYSGREYIVNCDKEHIYKLLVDEYVYKQRIIRTKYYQTQTETALLFKIFINRTANKFVF